MKGNVCAAIFVLLGVLRLSHGLTDADCSGATVPPTACASTNSFVPCEYNSTTGALQLVPDETPTNCAAQQICYKQIANRPATPCGTAPPACTAAGKFAFRSAGCSTFYACMSDGVAFSQQLGTCATGYEFNDVTKRCELVATAGCSVPAPVPPPTTACTPGQRFVVDTNCRHFRACNFNRTVVTKQCPFRLKFDATMRICRLNADCGSRPSVL